MPDLDCIELVEITTEYFEGALTPANVVRSMNLLRKATDVPRICARCAPRRILSDGRTTPSCRRLVATPARRVPRWKNERD